MNTLNLTKITGPVAGSGEVAVSDEQIITNLTVVDYDMDCSEERIVVWQIPSGFVAARLVGIDTGWCQTDWTLSEEFSVLTFRRAADLPAVLTHLMTDDLFAEIPEGAEVL
jgi:hypothetical protein